MNAHNKIIPHTIGFDFDGVIANTAQSFLSLLKEKHGYTLSLQDITDFEIENCTEIPKEAIYSIFTEIMMDSVATNVLPMPGAIATLSKMALHGPVTIITARPDTNPMENWLDKHFSSKALERLQVFAMGDHDDKVRYVKNQGLEYFIDDRAQTCQMMNDADIHAFVFEQPWNRGQHQLPTVHNWNDIEALLNLPQTS